MLYIRSEKCAGGEKVRKRDREHLAQACLIIFILSIKEDGKLYILFSDQKTAASLLPLLWPPRRQVIITMGN